VRRAGGSPAKGAKIPWLDGDKSSYTAGRMRLVSIDILSINLDIPFVPPLTQRAAGLEAFAAWLCDGESGLGLRPDQVRLKTWDDLFGYEMVAQFFGDNGLITRTADRIKLMIRNARTRGDWELVRRILVRFYSHMDFPPKPLTSFSANVHSRMPAADELVSFFDRFPQPEMASKPALFSYVKIPDWELDIRILIEKSNVLPDALFMMWDTQFQNAQDWDSFIRDLPAMMENSAQMFDLAFTPMA
jgi:hypothetical protein